MDIPTGRDDSEDAGWIPVGNPQVNLWLRISMDRISDSDSEDAGSIPAGATSSITEQIKTA